MHTDIYMMLLLFTLMMALPQSMSVTSSPSFTSWPSAWSSHTLSSLTSVLLPASAFFLCFATLLDSGLVGAPARSSSSSSSSSGQKECCILLVLGCLEQQFKRAYARLAAKPLEWQMLRSAKGFQKDCEQRTSSCRKAL
jgi:hypothetical protein